MAKDDNEVLQDGETRVPENLDAPNAGQKLTSAAGSFPLQSLHIADAFIDAMIFRPAGTIRPSSPPLVLPHDRALAARMLATADACGGRVLAAWLDNVAASKGYALSDEPIALLGLFKFTSLRPADVGHALLLRPWSPDMSLIEAAREALSFVCWTVYVTIQADRSTFPPWLRERVQGPYCIRRLTLAREFRAAALTIDPALYDVADRLIRGEVQIYGLFADADPAHPFAVFEVLPVGSTSMRFRLGRVSGSRGATVSASAYDAARRFVDTAERPQQPDLPRLPPHDDPAVAAMTLVWRRHVAKYLRATGAALTVPVGVNIDRLIEVIEVYADQLANLAARQR